MLIANLIFNAFVSAAFVPAAFVSAVAHGRDIAATLGARDPDLPRLARAIARR